MATRIAFRGCSAVEFSSRFREWSTLDEPEMLCERPHSGSLGSPPCTHADFERVALCLTESTLGMLVSQSLAALGSADDDDAWRERSPEAKQAYVSGTEPSLGMDSTRAKSSPCALSGVTAAASNTSSEAAPSPSAALSLLPTGAHAVEAPAAQLHEEDCFRFQGPASSSAVQHGGSGARAQQCHTASASSSMAEVSAKRASARSADHLYTAVMLRGLPAEMKRSDLLEFLDSRGFAARYDFAYLPVRFGTMGSLGHAFINMVSPEEADLLWEELSGFSDWTVPGDDVCQVFWNDKYQGWASLVERYRNSPVMHEGIPEECKPVVFREGKRAEFPEPTLRIKTPKTDKKRSGQ